MIQKNIIVYNTGDYMYKVDDEKIMYDDNKLFAILPLVDFGSTCGIYKVRIGKDIYAIKLYNGIQRITLEKCKLLQQLKIDSYITPLKMLYISDKFKGYAMKFCKDKNLARRTLDLSIEEFATSTVKLLEDTEKLSEEKFRIYDGYITNGMYDKGFKIIDTDDYDYLPDTSLAEIQIENRKRINLFLKDVFVKNTKLSNVSDEKLKKIIEKCDKGDILFDEVFNAFCTKAYNITDTEITNISDIGKVLMKK